MTTPQYTIYTKLPRRGDGPSGVEVAHWHTYPQGSVLEGQQQEVSDGWFATAKEALKAFPDAEVDLENTRSHHKPQVAPCPPSDFSYYDAGEYWHEDDY